MKKTLNAKNICFAALFTAVIAAGAFIKVPVPLIPFTLQTMFVLMAGLLLGSKGGAISAGLYLLLGLVGVPIFTQGGGIGYIFQPTFGYIIGFVAGAYIAGLIVEKSCKKGVKVYIMASLAGLLLIYLFGCVYLYFIKNFYLGAEMSIWNVLYYGFLVTIPGDLVLTVCGAYLVKRLKPVLGFQR